MKYLGVNLPEEEVRAIYKVAEELGFIKDSGRPTDMGVGNARELFRAIAQGKVKMERLRSPLPPQLQPFLDRHKPFQIVGHPDRRGKLWELNVRYAQVRWLPRSPELKAPYLECWCEEPEGSTDLPELRHNRTFNLERMKVSELLPLEGEWRSQGLDSVEVEFELLGDLALAYPGSEEDVGREGNVVRRRITSTFWFLKEMAWYGNVKVLPLPSDVQIPPSVEVLDYEQMMKELEL